ncbi:MAG: Nucleoporin nup84 [Trizodia sp. TS-e1964]|nr:MAG: Nucleoporin nup84 [Trizodia sp. TS-e1964]
MAPPRAPKAPSKPEPAVEWTWNLTSNLPSPYHSKNGLKHSCKDLLTRWYTTSPDRLRFITGPTRTHLETAAPNVQDSPSATSNKGKRIEPEVERFAELLDTKSPSNGLLSRPPNIRHENAMDLIREYRNAAGEARKRLRDRQVSAERSTSSRNRELGRDPRTSAQREDSDLDMDDFFDEAEGGIEPDAEPKSEVGDLSHWELEDSIWDILHDLLPLHYPNPGSMANDNKEEQLKRVGHTTRYTSEAKIWEKFLIIDDSAREWNIVLKWLKQMDEKSSPDVDEVVRKLEQNAERGMGLHAPGWLHTKEKIKAQRRLRAWPQTLDPQSPGVASALLNSNKVDGLVTQLDPDAVTRQKRTLEKPDQYFEEAIWRACWTMLRRGKDKEYILGWCARRLETWRAASMSGSEPAWDSTIDGHREIDLDSDQRPISQVTGNRSRALWRRMCYQLCLRAGLSDYERAVYGALSGDLPSVEKIASTWYDHMFAHYNALLLTQFDKYLQQHFPDRVPLEMAQKFPLFDALKYHGEPAETHQIGTNIIKRLRNEKVRVGDLFGEALQMLQASIIAKDFISYSYEVGRFISRFVLKKSTSRFIDYIPLDRHPEAWDPDFDGDCIYLRDYQRLRLLVHILFIHQDLGVIPSDPSGAYDNIIYSYILFLRDSGKMELVPLYVSRLSEENQLQSLAIIFSDVTDSMQRSKFVSLMCGLGLNPRDFLRILMNNALRDPQIVHTEEMDDLIQTTADDRYPGWKLRKDFMGPKASEADERLIRCFEWNLNVEGDWCRTFVVGTRLYQLFLKCGHFEAARQLSHRVSSTQLSLAKTGSILGRTIDVEDEENDRYVLLATDFSLTTQNQIMSLTKDQKEIFLKEYNMKRQILLDQAAQFITLQRLTYAMEALEQWEAGASEIVE